MNVAHLRPHHLCGCRQSCSMVGQQLKKTGHLGSSVLLLLLLLYLLNCALYFRLHCFRSLFMLRCLLLLLLSMLD